MTQQTARSIAQAKHEEHLEKINSIYKIMTETIDLPSEGKFYNSGAKTVDIKPITAKEEDILSNERLLRSGKAFDELIKSCVVNWNGINFDDLLVGDKNAILIAIRIISLGDEYGVNVTCPNCMNKSDLAISLKEDLGIKLSELQTNANNENTFNWVSPLGINYKLRLLTNKDQIAMENEVKQKKALLKNNYKESTFSDFLFHSIVSIEEFTDKFDIKKVLDNAPSTELRALVNYIKEMTPDYDMTYSFECSECNTVQNINIPFTVSFFWPEGRSIKK